MQFADDNLWSICDRWEEIIPNPQLEWFNKISHTGEAYSLLIGKVDLPNKLVLPNLTVLLLIKKVRLLDTPPDSVT